jgi:hypothetical protein
MPFHAEQQIIWDTGDPVFKLVKIPVAPQEILLERINVLGDERDEWENKYYELVDRLKEDLQPKIATVKTGDVLIEFARWTHFKEYSKTQYEFYKDLFDLKEEGEEDNEIQ